MDFDVETCENILVAAGILTLVAQTVVLTLILKVLKNGA